MLLTEYFLNGIRTKGRIKTLTEEQKQRLFEFDRSAGYRGDFSTWTESITYLTDIKAEDRYRQAVAAGTKLSFREYREKVLNKK